MFKSWTEKSELCKFLEGLFEKEKFEHKYLSSDKSHFFRFGSTKFGSITVTLNSNNRITVWNEKASLVYYDKWFWCLDAIRFLFSKIPPTFVTPEDIVKEYTSGSS